MKTAVAILLFTATLLAARADTLILTNGDELTGDIIAETDTNIQIRVANPDYTITTLQTIPRANVTGILRETPAQKTERAAYEKLCAYRLHPDQEYTAVIALLDKFLTDHPGSAYAPLLRARRADWQAELQAQRAELQKSLDAAEASLADAERTLAGLHDFTNPIYEHRPITGTPTVISNGRGRSFIWSSPFLERYEVGEKTTLHPLRNTYENNVAYYRNRVARLRELLAQTEQSLAVVTPVKSAETIH